MANNLPAKRAEELTIGQIMNSDNIKKRFNEMLGKNAPAFVSTVISLCNSNAQLRECDPKTILSAAGLAAALNLPVTPSLGQAYIVPYKSKVGAQAQFQLGTKGMLQLALRSGQYRTLHYGAVYEGQVERVDCFTGEIIRGEKTSDKIVGYVAYMELINGFKKSLYMTVEEIKEHAEKYSKSYAYDLRYGKKSSVWSTNFNAMAKKTVFRKLLSSFGIVSIAQQSAELAKALKADQAVIVDDEFIYVDNNEADAIPVDTDTGEVVEEAASNADD